jgi:hypothetical protein
MAAPLSGRPELSLPRDPTPRERSPKAQSTKFREVIVAAANDLDRNSSRAYSIPQICRRHQIKRRRLYDVINVFTAIGCASRGGWDDLVWHGRDRIFPELERMKDLFGIDNDSISLTALFPVNNSVSLTSLTVSFLLLFPAIQVDILDLRRVSSFFSRDTPRYKTTLCKLYQIALILSAMKITERTDNACEIRLLPPFTAILKRQEDPNPLAITNLLNRRPRDYRMERRRREYEFHGASRPTNL